MSDQPPATSQPSQDQQQNPIPPALYLGCKHYSRACSKQCPNPICLGKFYPCRLCHDSEFDSVTDPKKHHSFDRHKVTTITCLRCSTVQPHSKVCLNCKQDFALYYCGVCVFYDDKGEEKKIFHCDKCGICRVGGRESFFHCDRCDMCLNVVMRDNHLCKAAAFKQDCPVCLSDLQSSRTAC